MRTIETKVYTFDELSDKAKENARDWFREIDDFSFHAQDVINDAKDVGGLMGIEIDRVYYSGFWSQGDGACFEGTYSYKVRSVNDVKEYAPKDETLHAIAKELYELQRRNFYKLSARVKHSGHYMHENCTEVEVTKDGAYFFDTGDSYVRNNDEDGAELVRVLRKFMKWIYAQLQSAYEYHNEDAQVDESITANEYEFTEEGKRV